MLLSLLRRVFLGPPGLSKKRILLRWLIIFLLAQGFKKVAMFVSRWWHSLRLLKEAQTKHVNKLGKQIREIESILKTNEALLPSVELEKKIVEADVTTLIDMLNDRETTSLQLVLTFLRRSITVGVDLCAVVEFNHFEAVLMAEECDRRRFENSVLPCLYGIPVSVKANYIMRGTESSMGMVERVGIADTEDGLLVQIIKEQFGAIPFVKTSTPTGILGNECVNYVYGTITNPYNKKRTCGGSTGGEACLIATGCSPLGFATDAAGSIRTPCCFSGVYGFMITSSRVTNKGLATFGSGVSDYIKMYIGPMGKSVRDLALVTKNLVNNEFMMDRDFISRRDLGTRRLRRSKS